MVDIDMPAGLEARLRGTEPGRAWLEALPDTVAEFADEWCLKLGSPFSGGMTGSWVAPCEYSGGAAVLKVGYPHVEARHEIDGLLAWGGGCAVRLFEYERRRNVLLLERSTPGTSLQNASPETQDVVIADLCRELWQTPATADFQSLRSMIELWCNGARIRYAERKIAGERFDEELIEQGLDELRRLSLDKVEEKLLATDLHAGNVLASSRRPWLAIDPKPHVGDPSYDLTQHLMNVKPRIESEGAALFERLASLAEVDTDRLLRWTFGRLCLEAEDLKLAAELRGHL